MRRYSQMRPASVIMVTERSDWEGSGVRSQVSGLSQRLNGACQSLSLSLQPMSVAGGLRFHVLGDPTQDPQQETEIFKTVQEWRNPDT
jgi:hypothetical protein